MTPEIENSLMDSLIKAAVTENVLHELESYPNQAEIEKISLPADYDLKMRRFIKRFQRRQKRKTFSQYGKKAACLILFFLGISFIVLLQFSEVRAACKKIIESIYDRYVQLEVVTPQKDDLASPMKLSYIPEGFYEVSRIENGFGTYIICENEGGTRIDISSLYGAHTVQIDNEHYNIYEITAEDAYGKFWETLDPNFVNQLVWYTEDHCYILTSSLDRETLVKIAENIQ